MRLLKPVRRDAQGFTLVEVVVALSVFSLILLATVTALRTFGSTQVSLDRLTGRVDELRTVSSTLRDLVESSARGDNLDGLTLGGAGQTGAFIRGDDKHLTWKATVLFGERFGGLYLVRVAREGEQLVLRWQESGVNDRQARWDNTPARAVVSGVQEFEVAYLPSHDGEWRPRWTEDGPPPVALRLRLRTRDRWWPELVMAWPQ